MRVRLFGTLAGGLGGGGAAAYQWVLRHPGGGTPGLLFGVFFILLAWLLFAIASVFLVLVIVDQAQTRPRTPSVVLWFALAFIVVLHVFGGSWPFWRP